MGLETRDEFKMFVGEDLLDLYKYIIKWHYQSYIWPNTMKRFQHELKVEASLWNKVTDGVKEMAKGKAIDWVIDKIFSGTPIGLIKTCIESYNSVSIFLGTAVFEWNYIRDNPFDEDLDSSWGTLTNWHPVDNYAKFMLHFYPKDRKAGYHGFRRGVKGTNTAMGGNFLPRTR